MQSYLHDMAAPKGELDTGIFDMDSNADDHATCLVSCCDKSLCNIAWFTQGKCFLIECTSAELCQPVPQTNPAINDSLLIEVRTYGK